MRFKDHQLEVQQEEWFQEQLAKTRPADPKLNPCLQLFGPGPDGKQCKTCTHLFSHGRAKNYYKCDLRNFTRGPGSDHKVKWPACGKYEEKK